MNGHVTILRQSCVIASALRPIGKWSNNTIDSRQPAVPSVFLHDASLDWSACNVHAAVGLVMSA